jgi:hypothetical protein
MLQQNKGCSFLCGPVAQLGARFHGMEEVIGSIPIRSTNHFNNLADSQKRRDTLSIRWFSHAAPSAALSAAFLDRSRRTSSTRL